MAATFFPDAILPNTFNNCSGVFISSLRGSAPTLDNLLLNKFCNLLFITPKLFDLIRLLLPLPSISIRAITYSSLKLSSVCFVFLEYSSFMVLNISRPSCSFTVDSKKSFIWPMPSELLILYISPYIWPNSWGITPGVYFLWSKIISYSPSFFFSNSAVLPSSPSPFSESVNFNFKSSLCSFL